MSPCLGTTVLLKNTVFLSLCVWACEGSAHKAEVDIRFPGDGVTGDYEPPGMTGTNWAQTPCKPALKAEPPLQLPLGFLGYGLSNSESSGSQKLVLFCECRCQSPKGSALRAWGWVPSPRGLWPVDSFSQLYLDHSGACLHVPSLRRDSLAE